MEVLMLDHRTADGVLITPGLRVFTIDCAWGTVEGPALGSPDWFDVRYDDGRRPMLNGERMSTRDLDGRTA
jgi:hypothetical protein